MNAVVVTQDIDEVALAAQERHKFIQGLRELADLYEASEALPIPPYGVTVTINPTVWKTPYKEVDDEATRKALKKIIRSMGRGKKEKIYNDWSFICRKKFGPIELRVETTRSAICRKVPTGNKVIHAARTEYIPERVEEEYEWVCDDAVFSPPKEKQTT